MVLAFEVSDKVGDGGELLAGVGWVVGTSNYWAWESAGHLSV